MDERQEQDIRRELEALVLDSGELEKLEASLLEFNIFEVLKIVGTEIRHSNMLAWLLNPRENHGIGDAFLRDFLKNIFRGDVLFFNMALCGLDDVEIYREVDNIDLKIISNENKFVIAIENKTQSTEHSNQLQRYCNRINSGKLTSGYDMRFIYLTSQGDTPSNPNWKSISYSTIAETLKDIVEERKSILGPSVYEFLNQYLIILGRYVVADSKNIEKICADIYKKHKKAIDTIWEYKPDIYSEITKFLKGIIEEKKQELILDSSGKGYARFTTHKIDKLIPPLGDGTWSPEKRILLFEFNMWNKIELILNLYIGPGDDEQTRKKIFEIAMKDPKLFNSPRKQFGNKWSRIYQEKFLQIEKYEEDDLRKKFNEFVAHDLKKIEQHFETHWN